MYEAQLSILSVDGMVYGCQGSDRQKLREFLLDHDHEGSSIHLTVRWTPERFEIIDDGERIYKELGCE